MYVSNRIVGIPFFSQQASLAVQMHALLNSNPFFVGLQKWTLLANSIDREREKDGTRGEGEEKESRDVDKRRRKVMSLQSEKLPEIPEETARVARILFPQGNRYLWLRDELGAI